MVLYPYFNPLKVGARIALAIGLYRFKARDEIEFSKAQYMEICNSTNEFDYGLALGEFCRRNNKSKGTLIARDLWGWFYAIERAKPWVYSILMSDAATRKNLTTIGYLKNPRKLSIGFHIRLGDFQRPDLQYEWERGRWNNRTIPMEWFLNVARQCLEIFGNEAEFLLISDGKESELGPFIKEFNPLTTLGMKKTYFSDMLALSDCDFIVCSNSSYSKWAAFLSQSPYVFFSLGLRLNQNGFYFSKPLFTGPVNYPTTREYAIEPLQPLPNNLVDALVNRLGLKRNQIADLLRGGYSLRSLGDKRSDKPLST
jgi:hypothetical protein